MFPPQPQHGIIQGPDLLKRLLGHLLEVLTTLPAAEEGPDVPTHRLQHRQGVLLQAWEAGANRSEGHQKLFFKSLTAGGTED